MNKTHHISAESGVAMVEFAIILPLLILILFGAIEFGLAMFNKQVITNASREGARYGIVDDSGSRRSPSEIENVVNNYAANRLITFGTNASPDTTVVPDPQSGVSFGQNLTVTVDYDYEFLVLPWAKIPIGAQTVMKFE